MRKGPSERFITGIQSYGTLENKIARVVFEQRNHPLAWYVVFGIAFMFVQLLMLTITWLLYRGVRESGESTGPSAGDSTSSTLYGGSDRPRGHAHFRDLALMRQQWRNSINRFAEAMTLFAVMCAGMFAPAYRPTVGGLLADAAFPQHAQYGPSVQEPARLGRVRGHHIPDSVRALLVYRPDSDFATLRDKATKLPRRSHGARLPWAGEDQRSTGSATRPLSDSADSPPAGTLRPLHCKFRLRRFHPSRLAYHDLPALFRGRRHIRRICDGAYAGDPVRKWYGLKDVITMKHIDWMAKFMLGTGLVVFYGYVMEAFYAWYSNPYEQFMMVNRYTGPYWPSTGRSSSATG